MSLDDWFFIYDGPKEYKGPLKINFNKIEYKDFGEKGLQLQVNLTPLESSSPKILNKKPNCFFDKENLTFYVPAICIGGPLNEIATFQLRREIFEKITSTKDIY